MKQVLKVNIGKNGFYTMLPFLLQLISKNILGVLSDFLKKRGILTNSQAVLIFQVSGELVHFMQENNLENFQQTSEQCSAS